jgi:hypothetical protein
MSCLPALAGVCPTRHQVRRDTNILTESTLIVAGADTHADTIHVAAITMTGAAIDDREFPATRTGYAAAIRFLISWLARASSHERAHRFDFVFVYVSRVHRRWFDGRRSIQAETVFSPLAAFSWRCWRSTTAK